MKAIALCLNVDTLHHGKYRDQKECDKVFGAGWIPKFVQESEHQGVKVYYGREALEALRLGQIQVKDLRVLQEELNPVGTELREHGSLGQVLLCLESPLFTPRFYDQVDELKTHFKHSWLFDGGTHRVRFPSFHNSDIHEDLPWQSKQTLCMITANKYYKYIPQLSDSPSFTRAIQNQLHDLRYQIIDRYQEFKDFDLYGQGWPEVLAHSTPDKLATLRKYKFSFVIENCAQKGYLTEKLIHAIAAGCIPIYAGATDIGDLIPRSCYLNPKSFDIAVPGQALAQMRKWTGYDGFPMIYAGRKWLAGTEGQRYSHTGFAQELLEAALS